jgi:heme/copper-type cytochrome/quinol oxidase subunit 2
VRARIAAERGRQAETNAPLSAMLAIAWRAIPAMTLAAAAAASMFWYASVRSMEPVALSDETFFDARRAGMERVVFADTSGLSRDDVLGTLVSQEEQRPSQR